MVDKKNNAIIETAKLALIVSSLPLPVLRVTTTLSEYVLRFLNRIGVLNESTNQQVRRKVILTISNTLEKTSRQLSDENNKKIIKSISDKLKRYSVLNLNMDSMTLDAIGTLIAEIFQDKALWNEEYFSGIYMGSIADTFYKIFLIEITKYDELHEYIEMTGIENIFDELYSIGVKSSYSEAVFTEFKASSSNNRLETDFVITEKVDTYPSINFIDREKELNDLREQIRSKDKMILVTGIAGIGKTQLCRALFQEYVDAYRINKKTDFDYIGYFNYYDSMDSTLVTGLKFKKTSSYNENVKVAWSRLSNISQNKRLLLIIDNVTNTITDDKSLKKLYGIPCTVIITSRINNFGPFREVVLGALPLEGCKKIFENIYGQVNPSEQEELEVLVSKIAAGHTKTIELLAYISIEKNWNITTLIQELRKQHFDLSSISYVNKTEMQCEYEKLFNLADLTEGEINVLEAFSVFSPLSLPLSICNQFFNGDAKVSEDEDIFNALWQKGWLQKDKIYFSMHPLIADVIFAKLQPKINNHIKFAEACVDFISVKPNEKLNKALQFLPIAEAIVNKLYDGTAEVIGTLSSQIAVIYKHSGENDKALEWYKKALEVIVTVSGNEHPSTANIYSSVATVYTSKDENDNALEWYEKALSIWEKVLGNDHPITATTFNNIAECYKSKGMYNHALEWYQKALAIREKVLGLEHPDTAATYNNIAGVYQDQGEYGKTLEWYKKALVISEKVLGQEHPDTATIYNNIGFVYQAKGEYEKAPEYYQKALAIREKVLGQEHPDTATTYNNIAVLYQDQGVYEKALEYNKKALAIREKVLGQEHPSTAITYNNIAGVYKAKGEYEKALEYCQKALAIREKVLGQEHPDTATAYNNIAVLYQDQGEYEKALEYNKKALAIREKVLGQEHPLTATTYNNIAGVYQDQGEYEKALEYNKKDLAISEKVLGQEHPDIATTYNNIAGAYKAKGEYEKALEYSQKALAISEKVLGQEHPDTAMTYNNIALLYQSKGEYEKALEWYKKALTISEKVLGLKHPFTAIIYNNIAGVYQDQGEYEKALEYNKKDLAISEKVFGQEHPSIATTYNNIGLVYKAKGEYEKALKYSRKALAIREKVLGQEHPDTATTYNNIAGVYRNQREYEKALEYYKKALAISEKVLGQEHPSTATTYNNIALVYKAKGEYIKALEYNKKALAINEKVLGQEHPDTATAYNNIAVLYQAKGEYEKALEYNKKALAISEKVLGQEHPSTAMTYNNIGLVYQSKGEYGKALEYNKKALAISEKVLGLKHPFTAITYNNIVRVYQLSGDLKPENVQFVLDWGFKAINIFIKRNNKTNLSDAYKNVGGIYRCINEFDKAIDFQSKCIDVIKETDSGNKKLAAEFSCLGDIYFDKEEFANAIDSYNEAIRLNENLAEAWLGLEKTYFKLDDYEKTSEILQNLGRAKDVECFENNLKSSIYLTRVQINNLYLMKNIDWEIMPNINVLLGRNGYGKSYIFRLILCLLQKNSTESAKFFDNCSEKAEVKVFIDKDNKDLMTCRIKTLFEKSFGIVPVLGIPNARIIDKSGEYISYIAQTEDIDLKLNGAYNFIYERMDENRIRRFLYELGVIYLNSNKSFTAEIFILLEKVISQLTDSDFKFNDIKVLDNGAAFQIMVITENSKIPIPFQKVSEGTMSVLVVFGLIYSYLKSIHGDSSSVLSECGIVFIDEIDAHLHPEWQRKIVPLLRRTFPNVQFLLTAHSPLIIGGCLDGEVSVLKKESIGDFTIHQFRHDFIGWDIPELYNLVFEVEQKDLSYLYYSGLTPFKDYIELEIQKLEEKDELTPEDKKRISKLYSDLYYIEKFKAKQAEKQKDYEIKISNRDLMLENKKLRMQLESLNSNIPNDGRHSNE